MSAAAEMPDPTEPGPFDPPPTGPTFTLLTPADLMAVTEVMTDALDGDGSTAYMPDVTPGKAATWMLRALFDAGYVIAKQVER